MRIVLKASPRFHLWITKEMIDLLMYLSASHYDGVCQVASKPGGFLFGWNNTVLYTESLDKSDPPTWEVSATFYSLDTSLKIMEQAQYALISMPAEGKERARKVVKHYEDYVRLALSTANSLHSQTDGSRWPDITVVKVERT